MSDQKPRFRPGGNATGSIKPPPVIYRVYLTSAPDGSELWRWSPQLDKETAYIAAAKRGGAWTSLALREEPEDWGKDVTWFEARQVRA